MKKLFQCVQLISASLLSHWCLANEATEHVQQAVNNGEVDNSGFYALAAGLTIAIAAFGGALGQGRVGAIAMEGIARNPQAQKIMFIPMIIVLALIESFVIFSFAIAMIIAGKL